MTTQHRQQPSRLSIPPQFQFQQQHVPLYSPGSQTAIHQGFPSAFPPPSLLHTPIQPPFYHPHSGPPPRPIHQVHRAQTSVVALAAAVTPHAQSQFSPGAFGGPQFHPRGPPKAQLGGVGKNYRPPSPTAVALANVATQSQKGKKVNVNLPKEIIPAGDGQPSTHTSFARIPLPPHLVPPQPSIPPPDVSSATIHPEDTTRVNIPNTIDVFLPGRSVWDAVKNKFIEEKLQKLGVEKTTDNYSTVPHIHAPHARAASISSPADPTLLYFKLNKLQQTQNSQSHSASVSPQPPQPSLNNMTPPPLPLPLLPPPPSIIHPLPPAPANSGPLRHGYSLSLAAAPFVPSRPFLTFNAPVAFNPFPVGTSLGNGSVRSPDARSDPGAPTDQSLAPSTMPARADSRPDFARGFGLDVPEEAEEEVQVEEELGFLPEGPEEDWALAEASHVAIAGEDDTIDMELDVDEADAEVGSITTAAQSRAHSRHVSRLSAALSLRSVGGHGDYSELEVEPDEQGEREGDDPEDEAIGEWTGSEDLRTTTETTEDEESIGEWSNPSDEERARQDRQQRRLMRRAHHQQQQESIQVPRRIPNFPHPPPNPLPLTSLVIHPLRVTEEDMISNPSDDSVDPPHALPLPPSSRPLSSRLSIHDPARAHSRAPSSNLVPTPFQMSMPIPIQAPVPKRTEALNPHAKPFIFGSANRLSGSFVPGTLALQIPQQQQQLPALHVPQLPSVFSHARGASYGKPLNAGAAEFKPSAFTFTLPPNVPKFPLPQTPPPPPTLPSPLSRTVADAGLVRPQQGREKRQRRSSMAGSVSASDTSENGKVAMTSFKFPQESPVRKSAPPSPAQRQGPLNVVARPFTLPVPSGMDLNASPISDGTLEGEGDGDGDRDGDEDGEGEGSVDVEHELPIPLSMKARRAPIPLDFKHPVSTNTVPAGLFKALANGNGNNSNGNNANVGPEGEERTRRMVRSRLNSREIFEHVSRPSLDDLHVPAISHKGSRGRLVTDPGRWDAPALPQEPPQPARDRRASLPVMGSARSSFSDTSIHPPNIPHRLELQQYEERLEALLESKLDDFREEVRALRLETGANGGTGLASTEAAINEVVTLFRAQLQESAARGLDDTQIDARGELDFQLVKDIVEQGHAEARAEIQQDLDRILRRVEALQSVEVTPINGGNTEVMLEEYHARTRSTVVNAIAPITARLDALERTRTPLPFTPASTINHEALMRELHAALVPHIAAMRAEPIDYDLLTEQLSQAVKPHISQLIDLASDKRETAGLIVDRLIPVLPKVYPPVGSSIDIPAVVAQATTEVRRIVAQLDAHEIKEQVSDLVVERLDSRLAVRDRGLDGLSSKLMGGLDNLLGPVQDVATRVAELASGQLAGATEPLRAMLVDLISMGPTIGKGIPSSEDFFRIGTTVENLSTGQQSLQDKVAELLALHQDVLSRLTGLPNSMTAAIKAAQLAHAELLARTVTREDFEEVQLAKARAQYGAVRAEKDIMMDRISSAESERDQLRARVDDIQAIMLLRATDAATSQARTSELEEALSQSLARLKTSDVTIESQQERLLELEKLNRDLTAEKQIHTAETEAHLASRDQEAAVEALAALRKDHDALLAQQAHWEDLRRTTEQLDQLAVLPELKELRHIRDRSKVLEGEYAALQRRFKEQETRVTNSDRAASALRTSLVQAQQRSAEWEQRANEHEVALTEAQLARERAEDCVAQLEEEHSLVKLQFEEKDAEERLARDRESKLRDEVAALEAHVAQLQADASLAKKAAAAAASSPPRPDSRASTVYPSRSATPTASVNGRRTNTPPQPSVCDSMHNPHTRITRPKRQAQRYWPSRVASPTGSVVSVTPTLGSDGWYE
ncbi:hypothetical protein B0F90DRAFT_1912759 [Multifurca ochricompacta]|uniref:Uncharacterized protein n=1 Tax=Multifurca ochricompacta TaxID=376703 RepID=A0AAD4QLX7_9AGAM|nr:hypothetical protein B0F90DRAFT_1912759 [Multifurca ochricompacta]